MTIKVIFANNDYFITRINATVEEAENYYLNKTFNIGTTGDNMQKCVAIEILEA